MNLPDKLAGVKQRENGYTNALPNLNDELLKEFNKKKILKNLNEKISDRALKPASELHEERMVFPMASSSSG
jgi:hypothetical protein